MPTMEEYLTRPPDEVARLLDGKGDQAMSRPADARSWAPKEIGCHLRDVEELFLIRFQTTLAVEDPPILTLRANPEALASWGIGGEIGHPLDPEWVASLAGHDDNHLGQLERAVEGRP